MDIEPETSGLRLGFCIFRDINGYIKLIIKGAD